MRKIKTTTASADYQERVSYDANGNILKYKRNKDGGITQDSLNYKYNAGTNQLQYITDNIASNVSATDIDNQNPNNYIYDKSGNMVADNSQSMSVSWSPYGKILQTNKAGGANLQFSYNAMQQRVIKRVAQSGDTTRTYYIRDAQGNTMGVYTRHNDSVSWREQYIFGSSRLGLYRADTLINKGLQVISKLYEGKRNYEMANHLGNVMAVINDRKTDTTIGVNKGYNGVVISATDYFPFGMAIDSRSFSAKTYRYGFNDKENDSETGYQDYGMRIYESKVPHFLSIDPLASKYPELSPYQFASNSPIVAIDINGLEAGIEMRMDGWDRARANGTKTAEQINKEMQGTGVGGIIGAAIVFDAFFTKGYATRALIGLDLLNAISADHAASNIRGNSETKTELRKEASDGYKSVAISFAIGKIVGLTARAAFGTAARITKYLTTSEFKNLGEIGSINPNQIRFSQNSIKGSFKEGGGLEDFVKDLKLGNIDASKIEPIRIVEKDGLIFTLDNRRLYSFQKAGINIPYIKLNEIPKKELFKFSTTNQGTSIEVRK